MRHADIALVCTNPELSSVRDSDKMLSIVASKSKRAELGQEPVQSYLLITRYHADRVAMDSMLGAADIQEMLGVPLLGVVPESADVLKSTNVGRPVILQDDSDVALAYQDLIKRFLGEECELRFLSPKKKGFAQTLAGVFGN